jgi:hypothetical protein
MARGWRRGRTRGRRAGCLLWVVILLVVLVVLSLLFGGFQMGTKAGGDGVPAPRPVTVSRPLPAGQPATAAG